MKKITLAILICLLGHMSYAQDSTNNLLKKLVEKNILTPQEAEEIESETDTDTDRTSLAQTIKKVREAFNNTPYMNFGGYGMFMYQYSDVKDVKHTASPRLLFLNMGGKLTDDFGYFALFEFVNPQLYELYAEWTPRKEFNFRIGQFKVPFTIENPMSLTVLETLLYTRSVSTFTGMGDDVMALQSGKNNSGRDIGMQVSGSLLPSQTHDYIQYSMGIFQGSGMNLSDQNNTKDFAGTILIQPVKGFKFGGGAYFGQAKYSLNGDAPTDHVRNRWTIGGVYDSPRFYARAEWIKGKDSAINREGVYGTAQYYVFPDKLSFVGKVDYLNADKSNNQEVMDYTAGLSYYFYPRCRIHVNYTYSDYSKNWDSRNSNNVLAQLQIVF